MASKNLTILLLLLFVLCLCASGANAFGAGNIPSFAYMEGRAFRHGDIEDALADLAKKSGGFALSALVGKGGSKFGGLDIKRVYFGNWLRDYSQAVDIAGLKKLPLQTIINLCMVLGFLAHGYATAEFEVTEERLGVYLPVEHIDNPKGYGDGEDARKYHPKLRGPVDPRELEVDPRTGMKNYISNEHGGWDTSKALVKRTLERCIHLGRQYRSSGQKADSYESYRLLGQALHTLEDFSAHSNFCELALVSMGYRDVFVHVGDQVRIQAPSGKWVAPIVTGTFGGSDFVHSLLGEAGDHLSEASVSDLNKQLDKARAKSSSSRGIDGGDGKGDICSVLRGLFSSIPGGEGNEMSRDMEKVEKIRAGQTPGGKKPEEMSPQELHAVLWQVLSFRDSVAKKISKGIEKIPGLGPLIEKIMDGISVFVFTTLEPFVKPLLQTATASLSQVSEEVINNHDQYEVFNDPRASDPTHSFLSKDHFNLILNEPAGKLAKCILVHTVQLVTKAWEDNSINIHQITEDVTSCLFHPDFHNSSSQIQREMLDCMRQWVQGLGHDQRTILSRLTKNSVRNHENVRMAGEGGAGAAEGSYAQQQGQQFQGYLGQQAQGYLNQIPGGKAVSGIFGGKPGHGTKRGGGEAEDFYNAGASVPGSGYGAPEPQHSHPYSQSGYVPPSASPPLPHHLGYGPPSGPPPPPTGPRPEAYDGHPQHSSYAPSYGHSPALSFPNASPPPPPGHHSGYAPSYASPPPSFPDPNVPHHHSGGHGHGGPPGGYGGGPPSFPHPNAPPSFPGAPNYGNGGYGQNRW